MIPVAILGALLSGVMLPLQAVLNGRLGRALGSPVWGSAVSVMVTSVSLVTLGLVLYRAFPRPGPALALPWWFWAGGLCGVVSLVGMSSAVGRLGAAPTIALVISGQVIFSLLLDRFGLFGLPPVPIAPRRLVAAVLLLAGAILVR